jgi:S-formylglutathione hydrolase
MINVVKQHRSFNGTVSFNQHDSFETKTKMNFSTFIPDGEVKGCLIWLSGTTCNEENFMMKAASQKYLAEAGLMVICPDTSPRGLNLPGEHVSEYFGSGASFYIDATTPGYKDHYRMYSYVTKELYQLIENEFKMQNRISIFGHSMGGFGALVMGLREKNKFQSVSAFAPVVNPTISHTSSDGPLVGYLGENPLAWAQYDACELIKSGHFRNNEILIDQGLADPILPERLLTKNLIAASKGSKQKMTLRLQDGYDHTYYFVSTFMADHIRFHANYLK